MLAYCSCSKQWFAACDAALTCSKEGKTNTGEHGKTNALANGMLTIASQNIEMKRQESRFSNS